MARPLLHEDVVGFRLSSVLNDALDWAAAALGVSKSELIRALVVQALENESIARAAIEDHDRPQYPRFTSELRA
jgi:hypothetical protein